MLNKIKFTFFDHVTLYYYIGRLHKQDIDIENNREFQNQKNKKIKKSDKTSDINPIAIKLFNLKS